MKISYRKVLLLIFVFAILALFNMFLFNIKNLFLISFILLIGVIALKFFVGYERANYRGIKDICFNIFVCSIVFLIITYLLGLFTGFTKNGYSLEFISVLKNVIPFILYIFIGEIFRYMLVSKSKGNRLLIPLIVILFILIDINININVNISRITSGDLFIEKFLTCFFISVSKNIFLTYISYKVGYKPCVMYLFIFEATKYFIPIFPDFGLYFNTLLDIVFPAFLLYINYNYFNSNKPKNLNMAYYKYQDLISIICIMIFIIFVIIAMLCSGIFRYYIVTIGSSSMSKYIEKGDIVLIDKKADTAKFEKQDIMAFKHEGKIIVHRVIDKVDDSKIVYYTKGDNNKSADGFPIYREDIMGKVKFRIKYIGYPTVMLNEIIKR